MKLWVDDIRDAPDDSWTEVRKVEPAVALLAKFPMTEISLDHDIEYRPSDETFKPLAYYIGLLLSGDDLNGQRYARGHLPKITIHSDNPVGAKEMIAILNDYGITAKWEPYSTYGGNKN